MGPLEESADPTARLKAARAMSTTPRPSRAWIVDALGDPAAFERLTSELPATELWSVLLEVARARAGARSPAQVLAQYRRDRFVRPAPVDQRTLLELDAHLLASAPAFEAIELSPVAPLGTCSTMALTDQHRVLSALRGTEVVSDPTNVLALECAARLAAAPTATVKLATCQRVLRAQALPNKPGLTQHFRIFTLATGGRETKDHALAVAALVEHVRTMLAALARLERAGYAFGARRLDLLATPERSTLGDRIAAALPEIAVARKALDHPYYSAGVRYMLWVTTPSGAELPLADGGAFDWLGRLTANRRNVFVASGMGAQLIALLFRAPAA
jgi:hypothetical protein